MYEIILTLKCNWNCGYCSEGVNNRKALPFSIIANEKLPKIPFNSTVRLSGGEVGTLDEGSIDYIITHLMLKECTIELNTNGLFLDKYLFYTNNISKIRYHCSEDLTPVRIKKYVMIDNIEYIIIVTDDNIKHLDDFLKINNDTMFTLIPATKTDYNSIELSSQNIKKILKKNYSNISSDCKLKMLNNTDFYEGITYI
jgi:hypothetical protein